MEAEEIVEKESKGNGQEKKKMTKEKHEKNPEGTRSVCNKESI